MKQIEFKTSKGEFLVIEFPQVLKELSISRAGIQVPQKDGSHLFISGNLTPLGYIQDITEEQAKEVVDDVFCAHNYPGHINYIYKRDDIPYVPSLVDAIESFHSLLEVNGVVFENIFGENHPTKEDFQNNSQYLDDCLAWSCFEDKVFNKQQTYIFKKI